MRRRVRIVFALMTVWLVAACGPDAPHKAEASHAAKRASAAPAEMSEPTERRFAGTSEEAPAVEGLRHFAQGTHPETPPYLPIYPGAKIRGGFARNRRSGSSGTLIFETGAEPSDVIAFYRQNATASGFSETMNQDNGGTLTFGAGAGRRRIQVTVQPTEGGSHVQIFWAGGE